eukprot:6835961-Pyramimonas_sp.AAC.1
MTAPKHPHINAGEVLTDLESEQLQKRPPRSGPTRGRVLAPLGELRDIIIELLSPRIGARRQGPASREYPLLL